MHYIIIIATEDTELFKRLTAAVEAGLESVEVIRATTREEAANHCNDLGSRCLQPSSVVIDNRLEDSGFLYSKLVFDREKSTYAGSIISCGGYPDWVERYMDDRHGDIDLDTRYPWLLPRHIESKDVIDRIVNP